eukprot:4711482-Prymnesium_polylepis.1
MSLRLKLLTERLSESRQRPPDAFHKGISLDFFGFTGKCVNTCQEGVFTRVNTFQARVLTQYA